MFLAATLLSAAEPSLDRVLQGFRQPPVSTGGRAEAVALPYVFDGDDRLAHSDHVRESALDGLEVQDACYEPDKGRGDRRDQQSRRRWVQSEDRPPESFDDSCHGIEPVDGRPRFLDQTAGVRDRSQEQPHLNQEWHRVLNVAEPGVQGRKRETDGECCS